MKLVLDTSVWIEYFEGSETGSRVRRVLESKEHYIITPTIVLAELADAHVRGKVAARWDDIAGFVAFNTDLQDIDVQTAHLAATLKAELRKKHPNIGLSDCIILATARGAAAQLITKDAHLIGEQDVIDVLHF